MCLVIFMFLVFCMSWYFGAIFMLSVRVQLIAWKDRPQSDLLSIERDVKHLLTHSLTIYELKLNVTLFAN